MRRNKWSISAIENKNNPIVQKHLKSVRLNILIWTICTILVLVGASLLTFFTIKKGWDGTKKYVAIVVPWVVAGILLIMDISVMAGNKVGVLHRQKDTIIFYSGIATNYLYVNNQLIYKGSSDSKMTATLDDGSIVRIKFKLLSFDIIVLDLNQPKESNVKPQA